jgi:hypothetical protein
MSTTDTRTTAEWIADALDYAASQSIRPEFQERCKREANLLRGEGDRITFYANSEHENPDLPPVVPADAWFWSVGDEWCAIVADWHEDWWEGAADEDIAARPDPWRRPIADVPTTGTLVFRDAEGETHYVPTPGGECLQPGHEGVTMPGEDEVHECDLASHRVRIIAPQAAADANGEEFCCGGCAAKFAEAYIGFGWDVEVTHRHHESEV